MAALALRNEERIGLGVAIAAHAALVALILWRPPSRPAIPPPERMTVTLSDEVGLTSAAPAPAADAAPDVAPEIGEPAPPEPAPMVQPEPMPQPSVAPVPQPRPMPRAVPSPRPAPRAMPPQQPRAQPSARTSTFPRQSQSQPIRRPPLTLPGGRRVGSDFLKGAGGTSGEARTQPAANFGASERASLQGAINRELKPRWKAPEGVDIEKLDTVITWELNPDGTLRGTPRFVSQSGKTPSNEAQAQRHIEQAIRAVQLVGKFDLPPQFYNQWKRLTWHFDRNLSR